MRITRLMSPMYATFKVEQGKMEPFIKTIHWLTQTSTISQNATNFLEEPIFQQPYVKSEIDTNVDKWIDLNGETIGGSFTFNNDYTVTVLEGGVISELFSVDIEEGGCEEEPYIETLMLGNLKPVSGVEINE